MRGPRIVKRQELNLMPVMNLITILIPLLLMTSSLVNVAVLDLNAPSIGTNESLEEDALQLALMIQTTGLTVIENGEVTELPCLSDCLDATSYDFSGLGMVLTEVKSRHPNAEDITIIPTGNVPFEVIVAAMDATRQFESDSLFPSMAFSGR